MQDAFFCFHNINAYHDEDDIVIDLLAYDDNTVLYEAELSNLRDPAHEKHGLSTKPPLLRRYVGGDGDVCGDDVGHLFFYSPLYF